MRCVKLGFALLLAASAPAFAGSCPGNPDAIGTSRTITVDPNALPRIGTMQYRATLPLQDHEVVITFDDGPLPPYSAHILDILASECVKVTYFMVGRMARAYPHLVKRAFAEGHTIANHSENHPFTQHVRRQILRRLPPPVHEHGISVCLSRKRSCELRVELARPAIVMKRRFN